MVKFDFKVSALNHYIILLNCRIPLGIGQDFSSSRQLPYLTNIMGQQKKLSLEIAITNLESELKKTETPLLTKVCIVKARVFPVVMHGCGSWTIKKAEHQRIDAFELWCWRRLLRVSWTTRRSNQSILNEINPEYYWKNWYWSWSSNTWATWGEEPTHWKGPWCWESLKAKGEGGGRGGDG